MTEKTSPIKFKSLHATRVKVRAFKQNGSAPYVAQQNDHIARLLNNDYILLTAVEYAFLALISASRSPLPNATLIKMLQLPSLEAPNRTTFDASAKQLAHSGLIERNARLDAYRPHPLVRAHFLTRLARANHDPPQSRYFTLTQEIAELVIPNNQHRFSKQPTNHSKKAAGTLPGTEKSQRYSINAYETELLVLQEFFPKGDLNQAPLAQNPQQSAWVLNEVGLSMSKHGHLYAALNFFERAGAQLIRLADIENASLAHQNRSHLYYLLGDLKNWTNSAAEALYLARKAQHPRLERNALIYKAWAAHNSGHLDTASRAFRLAVSIERKIHVHHRYLYGVSGIWHAEHLKRVGKIAAARRIIEVILRDWAIPHGWLQDESRCQRLLGDLTASPLKPPHMHNHARSHYDKALWIAESITSPAAHIEALLARGRWAARASRLRPANYTQMLKMARGDLSKALKQAIIAGYRIHQVDVLIARAWAQQASANTSQARSDALLAREISREMGYHWGNLDAAEVLGMLPAHKNPTAVVAADRPGHHQAEKWALSAA